MNRAEKEAAIDRLADQLLADPNAPLRPSGVSITKGDVMAAADTLAMSPIGLQALARIEGLATLDLSDEEQGAVAVLLEAAWGLGADDVREAIKKSIEAWG